MPGDRLKPVSGNKEAKFEKNSAKNMYGMQYKKRQKRFN